MKRLSFNIVLITFIFIVVSCYPTQYAATPTVKPEIIINSVDKSKIKSEIINYYMDLNYSVVNETDYSILLSSPEEKFGNAAYQVVANEYNNTSHVNLRFNMANIENSTRVLASVQLIIKKDNGREDVTDITNDLSVNLLRVLNHIKSQVE
jgi:hypothetical protein